MIGIGIYQIKSPKPAWFYSGEEPPKPEELTDLRAWNLKHGGMWVLYGVVILLTSFVGAFGMEGIAIWLFMGGIILPIPIMVWWHHHLIGKYMK